MFKPDQLKELQTFFQLHPQKILWKGDAAEFVSCPTPFTRSVIFPILNDIKTWQDSLTIIHCPLPIHFTDEYVKVILDHAYVDLDVEAQIFGAPQNQQWEIIDDYSKPKQHMSFFQSLRYPRYLLWQTNVLRPENLDKLVHSVKAQEKNFYEELKNKEIVSLEELKSSLITAFTFILSIGFIDGLCQQYLQELLKHEEEKKNIEYEKYMSVYTQQYDEYFQSFLALKHLVNDEPSILNYLNKYGNRSFDDYELAAPRFWETPEKIQKIASANSLTHAEKTLEEVGNSISGKHKKLLQTFGQVKGARGSFRLHALTIVNDIRQAALLQAKKRSISPELVFFMNVQDLVNVHSQVLVEDLEIRKNQYEKNVQLSLPMVLTFGNWNTPQQLTVHLTQVEGIAVSKGDVTGIIEHITSDLQQIHDKGRILMIPDSSPRYTHLYPQAQGIIFMQGGITSHGAIIAREYGIPAVSLGGKRVELKNGTKIHLDATSGKIVILS